MDQSVTLYVVPTPLGNLGDMTERAIEVLKQVDFIAAEDTRHSAPFLKQYACSGQLIAAHEHNEEEAASQIIRHLSNGKSVALISDAGTPAISDPGARIVLRVREAGFRITPLPGACAAITALSASGITDPHFLFYGFLPAKEKAREKALEELTNLPYPIIFYEAPHRIVETVASLSKIFEPERTLIFARELTKLFETIHSLPLSEANEWLLADTNRQRGEFVLILSGAKEKIDLGFDEKLLGILLDEGLPVKQISKIVHTITGSSKNDLYDRALLLKKQKEST